MVWRPFEPQAQKLTRRTMRSETKSALAILISGIALEGASPNGKSITP
jgi:hypothetical protein